MKCISVVAVLVAALPVVACTGADNPCLSATDVKQCEATRAATGGGSNNGLLYGLGGYMLGRATSGGSSSSHTRAVERLYYTAPVRQQMRSPSYSAYRSTPSYSSYRSSPSYSYRSSSASFRRR